MGIKTLWSLLDCCGESTDLRDLRGQTVAIDLAGWVVQNNQCRAMNGKVAKPHLRNVFFRTSALLHLGVKPIFVMDGSASELKRDTLNARREDGKEVKSLGRSRLKAVMNECRFLLSAMGITCVQSVGEGEALCAKLNTLELVDAVVTEDSDVFCYGARTVLRNFSVGVGASKLEVFRTSRIERDLGLTRDRLVLMAVLLGCDFFPLRRPRGGQGDRFAALCGMEEGLGCVEGLRLLDPDWVRSVCGLLQMRWGGQTLSAMSVVDGGEGWERSLLVRSSHGGQKIGQN